MNAKELEIQLALGSLSEDVKLKLAENPNTPKKVLTILSKDKNKWIRWYIAKNPSTLKKVLTLLSKDKDWRVRYYVAYNSNTPKKVLTKLSTDEWLQLLMIIDDHNT